MILRRIHTTGMKSKVHPTYKTKYRVANWAAYNQALVWCNKAAEARHHLTDEKTLIFSKRLKGVE